MTHQFSHLVWLGAGSATEPAGVMGLAEKVTLFEARESACLQLKQRTPNANVKHVVISANGEQVNFKEYNLAEFSAVTEATGLLKLFPGLKEKSADQIGSTAIDFAISDLQLSGSNNLLVMDIADFNLPLLRKLEQKKLLSAFSEIQIQSSNEQLYSGAATTKDIMAFLQSQGYLLQQSSGSDPDLPWLTFNLNPLWSKLQQAQHNNNVLQAELAQLKQQINTPRQDSEQQMTTVKVENEATLKMQKEKTNKFSSDAEIDAFISDISAFFTGKNITYVDIGAYTGEILEKIIDSKKITVREAHLYEPNPESFKFLQERFAEKKIHSFHANNFAMGDSEKKVTLLPAQSMTKIISSGDVSDSKQDVFVSKVKTLDAEINKITEKHIHLLKIDVEGYEVEVLRGAEQSLKNQLIDVIYIEVGFNKKGTQQTYMADIDNFLQDHDYRVFKIYEQKNEWIEDLPLLRRCNFAYMSTSFAKANPFKLTMTIAELKRELKMLQSADKKNPL